MKIPEISFEVGVNELVKSVADIFKIANDEISNLLEFGLTDYLINQASKYWETNSFLHQERKVNFIKTYYPISVSEPTENKSYFLNEPIGQLRTNRFVTIIGNAGSGKSTLTKFIFLSALKEQKRIPILIELRLFNDEQINFENYILNKLLKSEIKPNEDILYRALRKGKFIFIFDGYDELYSSKINKVITEINDFIDRFQHNYFIVTSRPGAGAERINRFKPFYVNSLKFLDVINFVYKAVDNLERQQNVLNEIRKKENKNYVEYLSNPLLLSMFLITFKSHPEIPKSKSGFYRNVYETLYSKHDGIDNNSFKRERVSGLDKNDFETLISIFSYISFTNGLYIFSEEVITTILRNIRHTYTELPKYDESKLLKDLYTTIGIIIKDGTEYQFPHRTLQEYFAANFIHLIAQNASHKELLYSKFISTLFTEGQDDYKHFLDLCSELDNHNFTKYCILPALKNLRRELNDNDIINVIKTLITHSTIIYQINCRYTAKIGKKKFQEINTLTIRFNYNRIIYQPIFNQIELVELLEWFPTLLASSDMTKSLNNFINRNFRYFELLRNGKYQYEFKLQDYSKSKEFNGVELFNLITEVLIDKDIEKKVKLTTAKLDRKIEELENTIDQNFNDITNLIKNIRQH
jgi:energy-coupling factor transporter ATP-binding protein EcfA2